MEQALQIGLIVEKICEFADFNSLKQLRLTNTLWNTSANRALRGRCETVKLTINRGNAITKYQRLFTDMVNSDLCLKLPVDASIVLMSSDSSTDPPESPLKILLNSAWRDSVVILRISESLQDSRLVPFLLQNLPNIKKLEWTCHVGGPKSSISFPPLSTTDHAQFPPLEAVEFQLCRLAYAPQTAPLHMDFAFLRQCPSLKAFAMTCEMSSSIWFLDFMESYKEMYHNGTLTSVQFQDIRFQIGDIRNQETRAIMSDAIAEFVNLNRPTTLSLTGSFDYNFPTLFSKIHLWSPNIRSLSISIPLDDLREHKTGWMLTLLKTFRIFAGLVHISVTPYELAQYEQTGASQSIQHGLPKVTSLEIGSTRYWTSYEPSMLQQCSIQLPNISRLSLNNMMIGTSPWDGPPNADITAVLTACQSFPALRHLSFQLELQVIHWQDRTKVQGGYFRALSMLSNLLTLEISLEIDFKLMDDKLIAMLFHGYQPSVELALVVSSSKRRLLTLRSPLVAPLAMMKLRYKLQFSVEQFKEALGKAQSRLQLPSIASGLQH